MIQGAPGAGKTAMLDVLSSTRRKTDGSPYSSTPIPCGALMSYSAVWTRVVGKSLVLALRLVLIMSDMVVSTLILRLPHIPSLTFCEDRRNPFF